MVLLLTVVGILAGAAGAMILPRDHPVITHTNILEVDVYAEMGAQLNTDGVPVVITFQPSADGTGTRVHISAKSTTTAPFDAMIVLSPGTEWNGSRCPQAYRSCNPYADETFLYLTSDSNSKLSLLQDQNLSVTIPADPRVGGYGADYNSAYAAVHIPRIVISNSVPSIQVAYQLPDWRRFSWLGQDSPTDWNGQSNVIVWLTSPTAGINALASEEVVSQRAIEAVDDSAVDEASRALLITGALVGVAGACIVAIVQELAPLLGISRSRAQHIRSTVAPRRECL